MTTNRLSTCPGEIPPSNPQSDSTGIPAASTVRICVKLAVSFPSTISRSLRSVIMRSTKVRRSFSCATAVAALRGAKKSMSVSWSIAKMTYSTPPNRARVPTSPTSCQPTRACQAVHIRMNITAANAARTT